jgi:hypothetical protein
MRAMANLAQRAEDNILLPVEEYFRRWRAILRNRAAPKIFAKQKSGQAAKFA